MNNTERQQLCNDCVTKGRAIKQVPSLDPVMTSQCSNSTKTNDKALALVHAVINT